MTTPLSQPFFDILIALAPSPAHGYELMGRIEDLHGGSYRPGAGVLYTNIQKLVDLGWVAPEDQSDPRRKCYKLTGAGRVAAQAETERQDELLGRARTALGAS